MIDRIVSEVFVPVVNQIFMPFNDFAFSNPVVLPKPRLIHGSNRFIRIGRAWKRLPGVLKTMALDLASALNDLQTKRPLVHHITNAVTINDCANITLCIGAAPVMAEAPEEVAEMVAMAGALVLNIGTLSKAQISSMLIAGRAANDLGVPVILDPVGAGATRLRTESAHHLLTELQIAVVKGNAGEIGLLAGAAGRVRGVDSAGLDGDPVSICKSLVDAYSCVVAMSGPTDIVTDGDRVVLIATGLDGDPVAICKSLVDAYSCTVAMSGPTDIVTDGDRVVLIANGDPLMGSVSGTGCMVSSLAGAFAAGSQDLVCSTTAALAAFGLAGENAARQTFGPSSFKVALFDEVAALTPSLLAEGARIQVL